MYQLVRKGNHAVSATVCVRTEEIRLVDQRLETVISGVSGRLRRNDEEKERGRGNPYQLQRIQDGVYHLPSLRYYSLFYSIMGNIRT
ncbi:hypothetical protein Golax_008244 [Gossypium laxum]|uniref:Uncharacterized protein n=1 Tax=Gossypium laxum TaxID=34288 RepID=A0A7J9A9A6_9ROSI|nr:hypothetical protein [Gossypium laxum]